MEGCKTYGRSFIEHSKDNINPSNYEVVTVDGNYGIRKVKEEDKSAFTLTKFLGLVR